MKWNRIRFQANLEDYRPVVFPPPGPYWCSGSGDSYSIVVAYMPAPLNVPELLKHWPEADRVEVMQRDTDITFSDRFAKPDWWTP
jgi:hypothetical protein